MQSCGIEEVFERKECILMELKISPHHTNCNYTFYIKAWVGRMWKTMQTSPTASLEIMKTVVIRQPCSLSKIGTIINTHTIRLT